MYIHINMRFKKDSHLVELECACANIRRASRAITHVYTEELAGCELTPTQITILMTLNQAGTITQGKLGRILALDSTTLTRSLRPLLKQGWVSTLANEEDRRENNFLLTQRGNEKLKEIMPRWKSAQMRLKKALGEANWKTMKAVVTSITEVALKA